MARNDSGVSYDVFENGLGVALAVAAGGALLRLDHVATTQEADLRRRRYHPEAVHDPEAAPLPELRRQLTDYLAGERDEFDLPLAPRGTAFQQQVWRALQAIPCGETRSYAALAAAVGRPGAARAVGQANSKNPIGVVIPCHRVIAADGTLGGYAGGLDMKRRLLTREGR
ncbi:MAG TPA: methylated-DNA--[protein]-cysteine S-methyltransferase [Thermoanaerobaculia bacterium]|nr:methylated-DNA--[protein]-cysteine S-methyltransferase [Thermoanaerobaculia bacterium]